MPIIKVTQADLLKSKVLDADWYGAIICKVSGLEKSKDGNSLNQIITFRLDGNGKEIDNYFNSQAFGRLDPLHQAVFGTPMKEGEFDTDTLVGKKCDVKLIVDNYQGSLNNKIENFLAYGKGKGQTAPY